MTPSNPAVPAPGVRAESRQLLLIALCTLGIVVAAFAAPSATADPSPPDLPFPELVDGEREASDCVVALDRRPVPGRQVTVTVLNDSEPVTDVTVWFNDRSVGRTNESGQVQGRVPYARTLEIRVALASGGSCEFVTGTAERPVEDRAAEPDGGDAAERSVRSASVAGASQAGSAAAAAQSDPNVTGTYAVRGGIHIGVEGQTDPGTEVTLVATIEGEPVPDARVTVDGTEVGATDADGRIAVRVPDDGSERMHVRVERGEFRSDRRVPVRLLRVSVRGEEFIPLPGQNATVVAAIESEPVEDADVFVGGEREATTDRFGRATVELPANPAATVTVTTADRSESVRVASAYAPTVVAVLVAFVAFVLLPLAVFWAGGRRAIAALVLLVVTLLGVVGGYELAGPLGALAVALAVALAAAVVAVILRPEAAADLTGSASAGLSGFGDWLTDQALWLAGAIGTFVDQVRSRCLTMWRRIRDRDRDLVAAVSAWVVALPGRVAAAVWFVLGLPRRLVGWLHRESDESTEESSPDRREEPTADDAVPSIRRLWRSFASRVVPDRWPQRTPGEVSRKAVESGYPDGPVAELTDVFRDVEYGGAPLSAERYERARAAFDRLSRTADDDVRQDDEEVTES